MAPRQPERSRHASSSSEPIDSQIAKWLYDATTVQRWNKMKEARFFEGSFVVFPEFTPYRIQDLARRSHLESLLDHYQDNIKINHTLVKHFYANLNLGHQHPRNRDNYVSSLVCGRQVFLSLDRIGHILHTPTSGIDLQELNAPVGERDEVSH